MALLYEEKRTDWVWWGSQYDSQPFANAERWFIRLAYVHETEKEEKQNVQVYWR